MVDKLTSSNVKAQTNERSLLGQRPPDNDAKAWLAYWQAKDQPWRTEPEIDLARQSVLYSRRKAGARNAGSEYSFRGMRLSRAEVEWLLATHENGAGPVDWRGENQRVGLDLRGVDLSYTNLRGLPLTRCLGGLERKEWIGWSEANTEQLSTASVCFKGADLFEARMEGAILTGAMLQEADLRLAQLQGADLRHANLQEVNLTGADLTGVNLTGANLQKAYLTGAQLSESKLHRADLRAAVLFGAQLEGAYLVNARLDGANLAGAQLKGADLRGAQLQGADLSGAHLEGVDLTGAHLAGANLVGAYLAGANLTDTKLSDQQHQGPRIVDIHWGGANIGAAQWASVVMLDDEHQARQQSSPPNKETERQRYQAALRANYQLAYALRLQGLHEESAYFTYRARCLHRHLLRQQIATKGIQLKQLGAYLFSCLLDLVAGYGYRPGRSLIAYILIVPGCSFVYTLFGHMPLFPDALAFSFTALLGRGLFLPLTTLPSPLIILAFIEAIAGLILEISFIAIFTRRFSQN